MNTSDWPPLNHILKPHYKEAWEVWSSASGLPMLWKERVRPMLSLSIYSIIFWMMNALAKLPNKSKLNWRRWECESYGFLYDFLLHKVNYSQNWQQCDKHTRKRSHTKDFDLYEPWHFCHCPRCSSSTPPAERRPLLPPPEMLSFSVMKKGTSMK